MVDLIMIGNRIEGRSISPYITALKEKKPSTRRGFDPMSSGSQGMRSTAVLQPLPCGHSNIILALQRHLQCFWTAFVLFGGAE